LQTFEYTPVVLPDSLEQSLTLREIVSHGLKGGFAFTGPVRGDRQMGHHEPLTAQRFLLGGGDVGEAAIERFLPVPESAEIKALQVHRDRVVFDIDKSTVDFFAPVAARGRDM
jgi:hypothetical protein